MELLKTYWPTCPKATGAQARDLDNVSIQEWKTGNKFKFYLRMGGYDGMWYKNMNRAKAVARSEVWLPKGFHIKWEAEEKSS